MERIEKIKMMLADNPVDSFLLHALALEYVKLGNDLEAKALFEKLLENEPGYIGSYYHLAKLLERMAENESAEKVYKRGMEEAKKSGDQHAFSELKSAYEELIF